MILDRGQMYSNPEGMIYLSKFMTPLWSFNRQVIIKETYYVTYKT